MARTYEELIEQAEHHENESAKQLLLAKDYRLQAAVLRPPKFKVRDIVRLKDDGNTRWEVIGLPDPAAKKQVYEVRDMDMQGSRSDFILKVPEANMTPYEDTGK